MPIQILPREESNQSLFRGLETGLGGILKGLSQRQQGEALEQMGVPRGFSGADPQVLASLLRGSQAAQIQNRDQNVFNTVEDIATGSSDQPRSEIFKSTTDISPSGIESKEEVKIAPTRRDRLSSEIENLRASESDKSRSSRVRAQIRQSREKKEDLLGKLEGKESQLSKDVLTINKEQIADIRKQAKGAKEQTQDLRRLIELDESGKLDSASYDAFLKGSGLDIEALRSPESQEFNKITNNFIRDIKNIFGARISNQEMEQFMKTLPSLSQSPDGRKRVISNLLRVSRANEERGRELNKLLKANKGFLPADFSVQIDEAMDKKLDKFAELFKKDIDRKVPEAESALSVGAGAAAGRALPIASGAALGAGLGSIVPGLGTGIGAGVGAGVGAAGPALANLLRRLGG